MNEQRIHVVSESELARACVCVVKNVPVIKGLHLLFANCGKR